MKTIAYVVAVASASTAFALLLTLDAATLAPDNRAAHEHEERIATKCAEAGSDARPASRQRMAREACKWLRK